MSIPPLASALPPLPSTNVTSPVTSDAPAASPPSPPASPQAPPPSVSAPPPAVSVSPPPALSPPPPDTATAPPPVTATAPPPADTSPPPAAAPPVPALPPPPSSTPSPPSQPLSPPPAVSPPPPDTVSPPPPDNSQSPPPDNSQSPPPDNSQSPPPAPSVTPPNSPSPPPPSADPPAASSPPPPPASVPPPQSPPASTPPESPPSDPSTPPPSNASPPAPSPPSNSSGTPLVPSPPGIAIPPPLASPTAPSVEPNKSSNSSQNASADSGGRSNSRGRGPNVGAIIPSALIASIVMLSLVGFGLWYQRRRRRGVRRYNAGFVMPSPYSSSQASEASYSRSPTAPLTYSSGAGSHGFMNSPGLGNTKSWFTYEELHNITDGFSSKNLLGEGGFGCVYKGSLADGREVAVKQLKIGGGQGEREFAAEVEIISRVHHRHLVSLVGYCIADKQRLLVYDFVPNDTLDFHLHGGSTVLSWAMRVKIAAGAARGIAYLHEDCHPRIIHRDIKSSNILLDSNFEAQVADFGLARLAMDCATHVTTRVMGTFGYLAPEYASSGKLTDRSDVYSYGVVLLELITGRKPVDQTQPLGEESLVEWARPLMTQALDSGDFGVLPDARLEKNYNESEMFRMIEAAAACVRHSAAMRPKMGLVVRALDTIIEADINNGVIPGQSELFAAPQSAEIRMFQRMAFGSQNFSDGFTRSSWRSRTDSEMGSQVP